MPRRCFSITLATRDAGIACFRYFMLPIFRVSMLMPRCYAIIFDDCRFQISLYFLLIFLRLFRLALSMLSLRHCLFRHILPRRYCHADYAFITLSFHYYFLSAMLIFFVLMPPDAIDIFLLLRRLRHLADYASFIAIDSYLLLY